MFLPKTKSVTTRISLRTREILQKASILEDRPIKEIVDNLIDVVFNENGKRNTYVIVSSQRIERKRRSLLKKKK